MLEIRDVQLTFHQGTPSEVKALGGVDLRIAVRGQRPGIAAFIGEAVRTIDAVKATQQNDIREAGLWRCRRRRWTAGAVCEETGVEQHRAIFLSVDNAQSAPHCLRCNPKNSRGESHSPVLTPAEAVPVAAPHSATTGNLRAQRTGGMCCASQLAVARAAHTATAVPVPRGGIRRRKEANGVRCRSPHPPA